MSIHHKVGCQVTLADPIHRISRSSPAFLFPSFGQMSLVPNYRILLSNVLYPMAWSESSSQCWRRYLLYCKEDWPVRKTGFGIPHYRAKKKVVVNFIYGYQTLSGEKCKSNGKRISSIRHTSEEKNPKNHPKMPLSWYVVILGLHDEHPMTQHSLTCSRVRCCIAVLMHSYLHS